MPLGIQSCGREEEKEEGSGVGRNKRKMWARKATWAWAVDGTSQLFICRRNREKFEVVKCTRGIDSLHNYFFLFWRSGPMLFVPGTRVYVQKKKTPFKAEGNDQPRP